MPTIQQARDWYSNADPVHDFDHVMRVYAMAEIVPWLVTHGVGHLRVELLDEQGDLQDLFTEEILPVLTPLAVDPGHPFPFLSNLSINLAVEVMGAAAPLTPEANRRLLLESDTVPLDPHEGELNVSTDLPFHTRSRSRVTIPRVLGLLLCVGVAAFGVQRGLDRWNGDVAGAPPSIGGFKSLSDPATLKLRSSYLASEAGTAAADTRFYGPEAGDPQVQLIWTKDPRTAVATALTQPPFGVTASDIQPVKIADLARDLITLSGLRPDVDIEIRYTGVRPGEKLFEELSVDAEAAEKTRHPKIFVGRFRPHPWEKVQREIRELVSVAHDRAEEIRAKFGEIVPEYRSPPRAPTVTPAPIPLASRRAADE